MSSGNQYGPALPPGNPSTQPDDSFSFIESMTYTKQKAKRLDFAPTEEKKYDASAAGLHIMKKSCISEKNSERSQSSRHDDRDSQRKKVDELKKRIKKYGKASEKFTSDSHGSRDHKKTSKFKAPSDSSSSRYASKGSEEYISRHRSNKHEEKKSSGREDISDWSHSRLDDRDSRLDDRDSRPDDRESRHVDRDPRHVDRDSRLVDRDSRLVDRESKHEERAGQRKRVIEEKDREVPTSLQSCSSAAEKQEEEPIKIAEVISHTDDDLNKLSAKILKAEIMGNTERVEKLKKKLDDMKKEMYTQKSSKPTTRVATVLLTTTDSRGNVRPAELKIDPSESKGKRRKREKTVPTHDASGKRDQYFPDDKLKSLEDLRKEEMSIDKMGQDQMFLKYASKLSKMSERQNWTIDDMFESNVAKDKSKKSDMKEAEKIISKNNAEHKRLEGCKLCLDNSSNDIVVHVGKTLYVTIPVYKSMTKYHCQIIPVNHTIASVNADEDFWEEFRSIQFMLKSKFEEKNMDVVFLELAQRLGQMKHTFIDCIPVPFDDSALLPAFFKKAILDCDVEWAVNKKLVDTRKKGLRKSIPQGLPYFSVEFGTDGGFAHVIEDESRFKRYFGLEIVGGVIDCDARLWRNPERESSDGLKYKKRVFEKLNLFS